MELRAEPGSQGPSSQEKSSWDTLGQTQALSTFLGMGQGPDSAVPTAEQDRAVGS